MCKEEGLIRATHAGGSFITGCEIYVVLFLHNELQAPLIGTRGSSYCVHNGSGKVNLIISDLWTSSGSGHSKVCWPSKTYKEGEKHKPYSTVLPVYPLHLQKHNSAHGETKSRSLMKTGVKTEQGSLDITALKEENSELRHEKQKLENYYDTFGIRQLSRGLANQEPKALFLRDQLVSYGKRKIDWSNTVTMKYALRLYTKSELAYKYVVDMRILSLPHEKTLQKFTGL